MLHLQIRCYLVLYMQSGWKWLHVYLLRQQAAQQRPDRDGEPRDHAQQPEDGSAVLLLRQVGDVGERQRQRPLEEPGKPEG